ncbi:5'-nucleotidase C-terminal domain-containing protein [Acinetobacter sp. Ver3]|uniref:5'-nucleotidase C-terminal domain-containing protein n=1 Tax=Acinetobacter sp. Ver3 TaxID=466088 RepID=UPI000552D4C2|nr:5'-nucleotidase C-terminal domain-containing protein [Acinetobacter sp. Ver3]
MKNKIKITGLLLTTSLLLSSCGGDDEKSNPNITQTSELKILHINDHHSHLDGEEFSFNFDLGHGEEQLVVSRGGFSRVATFMNLKAENQQNVVKIHAGDAITGDLYYNLSNGKADAEMMNTVCFNTFTLGNHEFDAKDQGLKDFIGFLDEGHCKERTEILSANVEFGVSSPLYQTDRIQKSIVLERDGEKYGVVGLTIASKTKNSSQPNQDTLFQDEITVAQNEINQLKKQGIKKIILQTHVGYELDQKLAQELTDVDVIIGGDSHTLFGPHILEKYGMSPVAAYPLQLKNKNGETVCVAQAWQYSYVVGELNVKFDADGAVKSCVGTPHVLIGDDFKRKQNNERVSDQERKYIEHQFEKEQAPFSIVKEDQSILSVLEPYKQSKKLFAAKVVGQAVDNLCSRRVPGTQFDRSRSSLGDVCNLNAHVDAHGGDIQQMVAEAFLKQGKEYFNADISFQNAGGVRVDLAKGNITVADIYQVLPFKNTLVQLNMTGQEIKDTLEDAISGVIEQKNTGSYPYTAGLTWQVDMTQPIGKRITNIQVRNGADQLIPLDLNQSYKIVTINFLADGADYYHTLKKITGERRIEVGLDYAEAFLNYLNSIDGDQEMKTIRKLSTSYYSTQKYIE